MLVEIDHHIKLAMESLFNIRLLKKSAAQFTLPIKFGEKKIKFMCHIASKNGFKADTALTNFD